MNVIDIILEKINAVGADGLVNVDAECGCKKDNLCPCGQLYTDCELAENIKCKTRDCENCNDVNCHDYFIRIPKTAPLVGADGCNLLSCFDFLCIFL